MKISIVDYGMGNIGSLQNMIVKVGGESEVVSRPEEVLKAGKIILPGVGHFDNAVSKLKNSGLWDALDQKAKSGGTPMLCICLGAQLVTNGSEEGVLPGFGWIPGKTVRFSFGADSRLRVPHMGWNDIAIQKASPLLDDLPDDPCFYFVHSFYMIADDRTDVLTTTFYGIEFSSSLARGNIYATQFHPEKSHKYGMKVIKNFTETLPC
jgi:glutamine amidotransferase